MKPTASRKPIMSKNILNLASMHKPRIDITFTPEDDNQPCFITSKCTLDSLNGFARITTPVDTRFDTLEVALQGSSQTLVDRMCPASAVTNAQCARHKFLDLRQPNTDARLPVDKILRACVPYEIPFAFVIPDRLPVNTCKHKVKSAEVNDHHHALPPSLGDADIAGSGGKLLDDMSPQMCSIGYTVSVRVIQRRLSDGRHATLAEKMRKLRILSATEEQPPLDTDALSDEYCLHAEKKIKQSLLGRKVGKVTAHMDQPRSFQLPAPDTENDGPVTTTSTVRLRFDPNNIDEQPPRLGQLSSKLKASTFYASRPYTEFPTQAQHVFDASQAVYSETLNLNARNMESVQWTKHETDAAKDTQTIRHDSVTSTTSMTQNTPHTKPTAMAKPFYTAHFIVPTTLPPTKSFIPTFHSCLISRTYALQFSLSFSTQSRAPNLFNHIDLRVSVQITAAPSIQHIARRASYAAEIDEQYDDYRAPRRMIHGVPTVLAARDAPPAYVRISELEKGALPSYS